MKLFVVHLQAIYEVLKSIKVSFCVERPSMDSLLL